MKELLLWLGFISAPIAASAYDPAPYLVTVAKPTVAYAPDGSVIQLPAGTEIDSCIRDGVGLRYDTTGRTLVVIEPCPVRPLFSDGFD